MTFSPIDLDPERQALKRKNAAMTALLGTGWDENNGMGSPMSPVAGSNKSSGGLGMGNTGGLYGSLFGNAGFNSRPNTSALFGGNYFANGGLVYANEGYNGSPEGSVPMNSNADVPGLMTPQGTDLGGVVPRIGQGLGGLPPDPTSRYSQDLSDPRGLQAPMGTGYLGADGRSSGGGGGGKGGVDPYTLMVKRGGNPEAAARYANWMEQQAKKDPSGRFTSIADQHTGARMNAAVWNGGDMNAIDRPRNLVDSGMHFATGGVVGMHPGQPKGTDTVPAWLTPGEAVLTKEATALLGPERIEALNTAARALMGGQMGGMPPENEGTQNFADGGLVRPQYLVKGSNYVWGDDPNLREQLLRAVPQENHGWTEEATQGYRSPGVAQSFEQPQYTTITPYNVSEMPMVDAQRAQGLQVSKYQPNIDVNAPSGFNQLVEKESSIKAGRRAEGMKAAQAAYDQMHQPVPRNRALALQSDYAPYSPVPEDHYATMRNINARSNQANINATFNDANPYVYEDFGQTKQAQQALLGSPDSTGPSKKFTYPVRNMNIGNADAQMSLDFNPNFGTRANSGSTGTYDPAAAKRFEAEAAVRKMNTGSVGSPAPEPGRPQGAVRDFSGKVDPTNGPRAVYEALKDGARQNVVPQLKNAYNTTDIWGGKALGALQALDIGSAMAHDDRMGMGRAMLGENANPDLQRMAGTVGSFALNTADAPIRFINQMANGLSGGAVPATGVREYFGLGAPTGTFQYGKELYDKVRGPQQPHSASNAPMTPSTPIAYDGTKNGGAPTPDRSGPGLGGNDLVAPSNDQQANLAAPSNDQQALQPQKKYEYAADYYAANPDKMDVYMNLQKVQDERGRGVSVNAPGMSGSAHYHNATPEDQERLAKTLRTIQANKMRETEALGNWEAAHPGEKGRISHAGPDINGNFIIAKDDGGAAPDLSSVYLRHNAKGYKAPQDLDGVYSGALKNAGRTDFHGGLREDGSQPLWTDYASVGDIDRQMFRNEVEGGYGRGTQEALQTRYLRRHPREALAHQEKMRELSLREDLNKETMGLRKEQAAATRENRRFMQQMALDQYNNQLQQYTEKLRDKEYTDLYGTAADEFQSAFNQTFGKKNKDPEAGKAAASRLMPQLAYVHEKYYRGTPFKSLTTGAVPGYVAASDGAKLPFMKLAGGTMLIDGIMPWKPHNATEQEWVNSMTPDKLASKILQNWDEGGASAFSN